MKQIILYGLADASEMYRAVEYSLITEEDISISQIKYAANTLSLNGSVEKVYVIDNRPSLHRLYQTAVRNSSIESWAVFKDTLERYGLRVF